MQLCNAIVKIAHYLCYTSARGIFDLLFVQNEAFQAAIYPNWVYWRLKVSTCDPSDIGEIARSERPKRLNRRHNFGMYPCAKPANPSVPGSPRRKLPSRKRRPIRESLAWLPARFGPQSIGRSRSSGACRNGFAFIAFNPRLLSSFRT